MYVIIAHDCRQQNAVAISVSATGKES